MITIRQSVTLYCADGTPFLVDEEDAERVSAFRWCALRGSRFRSTYVHSRWFVGMLHRFLLGVTDRKIEVDHIDGDGLNNCKSNLRPASKGQNQHNIKLQRNNTSGVKGVCWCKTNRYWLARVYSEGRVAWQATFHDLSEASAAVRAVRESLHGEFARHE